MSTRAEGDFDIVAAEPLPLQSTVRPEAPLRTLAEFVRFLEALEEVFGPLRPNHPEVTVGECFRL